jgi:hypothetical protein
LVAGKSFEAVSTAPPPAPGCVNYVAERALPHGLARWRNQYDCHERLHLARTGDLPLCQYVCPPRARFIELPEAAARLNIAIDTVVAVAA